MDQNKTQIPRYFPYYGIPPLNPGISHGYKPSLPNLPPNCSPPAKPSLPLNTTIDLAYWRSLSPALIGAGGAIFLSLFSENDRLIKRFEGPLFKLTIVGYSIVATIAISFGISNVLTESKAPHDHLVYPIGGALVTIILLFAADFLLLYRFFPESFKGDVGDDFWTQLFSFIYLSITSIATGNLGDIMPADLTSRALIATEMSFYLFTMATAIQLLLFQKS